MAWDGIEQLIYSEIMRLQDPPKHPHELEIDARFEKRLKQLRKLACGCVSGRGADTEP
jgi:hypothetical protein